MKRSLYILSVLVLLLTLSGITAFPLLAQRNQAITIKGRVTNEQTNQPLAGANVYEPESRNGTATNDKGYFEIKVPKNAKRLRISFIGFKTRIATLRRANQTLKVSLVPKSVALNQINVVAYGFKKKPKGTTASVGEVTPAKLDKTNGVSLAPALNTVPGVRMDQSSMEDSRISIRGVGITAPWGIRNVRIYMNGIPLTQPNGVSRIEAIDASTVGSIEVFKGPAPSFGGGTAGVVNIQLKKAPYGKSSAHFNALTGSYGLNRLAASYQSGTKKHNAFITLGRQTVDGYRQHTHDLRRYLTGSMQFYPSQQEKATLLISHSRQEAHIPGALTAQQVAENPRQAASENVEKKAGRFQSWTRIGASHLYDFSDRFSNQISVYTYFFNLHHPLNFAVIMQPYQSYGGRTRFKLQENVAGTPLDLSFGGEYQKAVVDPRYFVNNKGETGHLFLSQKLDNTRYFLFFKAKAKIANQTNVLGSTALKNLNYNIIDLLHPDKSGVINFGAALVPRVSISHVFNNHFALRAGVSRGYSPPTTNQIKDAKGGIQHDVKAVKGVDYEMGSRGSFLNGAFSYDVTLFTFQTRDQLVPQTVGQGNTIYVNAGRTFRVGLGAAFSYLWANGSSSFINSLRPFVNYTYSNYTFTKFRKLGPKGKVIADFSGNRETGIAPHHLSAGLDIKTHPGFFLNTAYYFNSREPITDANTVYMDAYSLLNAQIGYKANMGKHFKIKIKAGFKNILDARYSPFVALNAQSHNGRSPAFYNPAPNRNYYVGVNFSYFIK